MTCSKKFGRLLQASCLGLIGTLTVVGCGGSETSPAKDGGADVGEAGPVTKAQLTASQMSVTVGTVDVGTVSSSTPVTITNNGTGSGALTVTPSGVGIAATGCTGSLSVNQSCTLSITATPTAAGTIAGSVSVAAAPGNTITIAVGGMATVPGNFTFVPTVLAFTDVAVGATVQGTITVQAGATALTGLTIVKTGAEIKLDAASTCGTTLAAGATCAVVVDFTAGSSSPTGAAITISQGGVNKTIPVTANVLAPAKLAATPISATLVATVGSSYSLDINVGNIGGLTTGQLGVVLGGLNAADFKVSDDKCSIVTLASGVSCTVTVTYTPPATASANVTATLTITDKGPGASVAPVALTGTPNPLSALTVTGGPSLGSVAPGAVGGEVLFTVTNTSATPSGAVTPAVDNANITVSSNTCVAKTTLNKGDTCTIGLKLTPPALAAAQTISASLTVTGTTGRASAPVTGAIVTGPALSADPKSVTFGSVFTGQSSPIVNLTISNTGATATAPLSIALAGTGAAQVAVKADSCSKVSLLATPCVIGLQYTALDTSGVNGQVTVSDGIFSVVVPMVGSGVVPANFFAYTDSTTKTPVSALNLGATPVGYVTTASTLTVTVSATATTDSGTITAAITGDNATEFAAVTHCPVSLVTGATCTVDVTFTPSAAGSRAGVLTITGSKGGSWPVQLSGTGLALVELIPLAANSTAAPVVTGLDFGMEPNGTAKTTGLLKYRMVVRGATAPTATSTVSTATLVTGTTPDFVNTDASGTAIANPCNGTTLGFPISSTTAPTNWSKTATTSTEPGKLPALTDDGQATLGFWTCDFYVEFFPQTGKSATPKTATINASASGSGTDTLTVTGISSGPLTISATTITFPGTVAVGAKLDSSAIVVANAGNSGAQGPLTVVLGGTNAGDFGIFTDTCTEATLTSPQTCSIVLRFAPTTAGAKTATLTVTAAGATGDTVTASINGSAGTSASITVSPTGTLSTPVDLGSAPQAGTGAWKTFTISSPAGAAISDSLTYVASTDFQVYTPTLAGVAAYPAGFCGDSGTKQLNGGESCIVQVRVNPTNTVLPSVRTGTLTVSNGLHALPVVRLKGTATPQLTVSIVALDFGNVAPGATSSVQSSTITNNGLTALTLKVPSNLDTGTPPPLSIVTGSNCNGVALAAGGTCHLDYQFTGQAAGTSVGVPTPLAITVTDTTLTTSVTAGLTMQARTVAAANLALYGFDDILATGSGVVKNDTVEFGNVQTAAVGTSTGSGVFTLWFTNTGGVNATSVAAAISGTNSTEFTFPAEAGDSCNSLANGVLAPKAKCAVRVQLTPQTAANTKEATLTLSGSGLSPVTVPLHGSSHVAATGGVYLTPVGGAATSTIANVASTAVNATTKVLYTVHNTSAAAISLSAFSIAGNVSTDATPVVVDFSDGVGTAATNLVVVGDATGGGTACPATASGIVVGASCQIAVTFKPLAYGDLQTDGRKYRWATINYSGAPVAAMLARVTKPALLQLSAASAGGVTVNTNAASPELSSADFGQVVVQQTASLIFTITNIGETATSGAVTPKLTDTGAVDPYATVTSTCGSTALPGNGGSCTATVTVAGTAPGLHGNDTIYTSLQATGTVSTENSAEIFKLVERLVQPALLSITASGTDFGSLAVGATTGVTLTITARNGIAGDSRNNRLDTGALTLNLANQTDLTVLPGSTCFNSSTGTFRALPLADLTTETCTVLVKFTPESAGLVSVPISVTAAPGGTSAAITLTGTGLGDLSITTGPAAGTATAPTALTGTPATGTYTFTNIGSISTGSLDTSIGGTNAALFSITSDTCLAATVAASGTCAVTVTFTGTSSAATAQTASLTITDGTSANSITAYMKVGGP